MRQRPLLRAGSHAAMPAKRMPWHWEEEEQRVDVILGSPYHHPSMQGLRMPSSKTCNAHNKSMALNLVLTTGSVSYVPRNKSVDNLNGLKSFQTNRLSRQRCTIHFPSAKRREECTEQDAFGASVATSKVVVLQSAGHSHLL